jgi:hypothetical protein
MLRSVKSVAGPDEVIGRRQIVGRIGDNATPSDVARPRLHCPHQPQLKCVPAMSGDHANPAKISGFLHMCRRDYSSKRDWQTRVIRKPPVSPVKIWNGRAIQERQTMEFGKCVGDIVVTAVNFPYSVHRPTLKLPDRSIPGPAAQ